jgi:uncharacterized phage-like protein YoqJ
MALGTDLWWAKAVLGAGLNLWAYVPFPQQPDPWPAHAKREWRRLLDRAAKVHYTADHYEVRFLHQRNTEMTRASTAVVAVWDPAKRDGGTFRALVQADPDLPVVHINPAATETKLTAAGRLVDPERANQGRLPV